jgi:hypothetical protein
MAKSRKPISEPEPPPDPQVGDRVIPERSDITFMITGVRKDARYVDLAAVGFNLTRFHVDVETLTFVDRVARPTQKSLNLKTNSSHLIERFNIIQRESIHHLDEDIELLIKYLKAEGAPTEAIKAVEAMRREQAKTWESLINRIKELME